MPEVQDILQALNSDDDRVRGATYQELLRFHERLTHGVMVIAATEKQQYASGDPRQHAVDLLTKFYSPQAIPLLVKYVDYYQPHMAVDEDTPFAGYPCAMALANFGQQATAGIVHHLVKTPPAEVSDKANELYAWLFIGAYGPPKGGAGGPKEALRVLESARDRTLAYQTSSKENYQRLLDTARELTKDWPQ